MAAEPGELRREVLAYLAQRARIAQSADTIARRLAREHGCTVDEVADALAFLAGTDPPLVRQVPDKLSGATVYWQATSAGVYEAEGGGR